MLWNYEDAQYWPNITTVLGLIGDDAAVVPLIDFVRGRDSDTEWSTAVYRGRASAIPALGYLVNKSGNAKAMKYLLKSVDPQIWIEREIPWLIARENKAEPTTPLPHPLPEPADRLLHDVVVDAEVKADRFHAAARSSHLRRLSGDAPVPGQPSDHNEAHDERALPTRTPRRTRHTERHHNSPWNHRTASAAVWSSTPKC